MCCKGIIRDVFGEVCGRYWFSQATGRVCFIWAGCRFYDYTDEGFARWLDKLELYAEEGYTKASWLAELEKEEA